MPATTLGDLTVKELREEFDELANTADPLSKGYFKRVIAEIDGLEAEPSSTKVRSSKLKAPWKYTRIVVGYVSDDARGTITRGAGIAAKESLKTQAVNLKFDGFWVADLPGWGEHEVLIKWTAKHHIKSDTAESVSFTQQFKVRDNDASADTGRPLFLSLQVPPAGIGFEFDLIYLQNNSTQRFLKFLQTSSIQNGLKMITSVNPALGMLSSMAQGIALAAAEQNQNRYILQNAYIGLDFQSSPSGVRIRPGTYIAAQSSDVDWSDWTFTNDRVHPMDPKGDDFPFNYFVFRIEEA